MLHFDLNGPLVSRSIGRTSATAKKPTDTVNASMDLSRHRRYPRSHFGIPALCAYPPGQVLILAQETSFTTSPSELSINRTRLHDHFSGDPSTNTCRSYVHKPHPVITGFSPANCTKSTIALQPIMSAAITSAQGTFHVSAPCSPTPSVHTEATAVLFDAVAFCSVS